ncbi:mechanosensitive ion channel-like protein [Luteimonas cucumeris]|uniref:Small-conductance mechanosensitive channel n=1 Tax=Luteimonas cucumeris TaxID=985012 RepID=A0A562LFA3_9GAMM|nr:mechanosensitive ion channel family protein [Luteimonas cucumeris]TWI06290.1 mechanosensitive ion channel-like protein [Luteimonas cucumeris]
MTRSRAHRMLHRLLWTLSCVLVLAGTPAMQAACATPTVSTAAPAQVGTAEPGADSHEVTVRYFNRDVMVLRGPFMGRPVQVRAAAAEANLGNIIEKPGIPKVDFRQVTEGLIVLLGGDVVSIITPQDLDALHGQTFAQARADIARRLGDAVQAAERDRAPRQLLRGVLMTLLACAVALLLMVAALRLGRFARARFTRWLDRRVAGTHRESTRHMVLGLRSLGDWTLRLATALVVLFVVEEWLRFVLGQFGFTQPWALAMTGWIVQRATAWAHAIAGAIPGLVTAVVIFLLARVITRTIGMTFRGVQSGRFQLFGIDRELAEPTRKLIVAVVWLFAVAMAYPYLPGSDTDAFKGLSVLVGLMVSLGASGIVGQAAGGFTILYSRTMSVGDLVRSGDVEGIVMQIGLFTTRIRTVTGVEVSIPNTVVLSGQLQNFSRHPDGPGMWIETGVTIGYDTPWRQVHRMLLDAAAKTAKIQTQPAPFVLQTALSDFYVEYRLRARVIDAATRVFILSELHANIQDAFNSAGVQIMSPHYEADPEQAKLVAPGQWEGVPNTLDTDANLAPDSGGDAR